MMIAPIDADKYEADCITEKYRQQGTKRGQISFVRRAQFEHHNRDDDRDHAITECFHAIAGHWRIVRIYAPHLQWSYHSLESVFAFPISSAQPSCRPKRIYLR